MKELKTSYSFTTGTGNATKSCAVHGIVSVSEFDILQQGSDYTDAELLDKTSGNTSELSQSSGEAYGKYSEVITLAMYPGEFFIGDRRMVVFNEKISYIATPDYVEESGNVYARIRLPDYPDGGFYINTLNANTPAGTFSPIILERYASGELSSIGVIFGRPISSRVGCEGVKGYCVVEETVEIDESGTTATVERVVEGEHSGAPFVFSPLQQFQLAYDLRESAVVDPSMYTYDFETNAIIFDPTYDPGNDEYVVSFEARNEPFMIPLNLSAKTRIPRDGIICISAENGDQKVASLEMSVSHHGPDEPCMVRVFLLSDRGMEVPGVETVATLSALFDSGDTFQEVPYVSLEGTPYALYSIESGAVIMGGVYLCDATPTYVEGYGTGVILPSVGSIGDSGAVALYISGETVSTTTVTVLSNEMGISSFFVTPSSFQLPYRRRITAAAGAYQAQHDEFIVPVSSLPTCYGSTQYVETAYALIRSSNIRELVVGEDERYLYFTTPPGIVSPSSIMYHGAVSFLQGVTTGDGTMYRPHHFAVQSGELLCYITEDYVLPGNDIIIRYTVPYPGAVGDGRITYCSDAYTWEGV